MIGSKRFAAGVSTKSNRMSLRPCPERASEHMCSTHVTVCVRIKTAAINMAEACFLGRAATVQLLIQLECVCVCVRGTRRAVHGCKEVVNRVKRLTEGTAWTEPPPPET